MYSYRYKDSRGFTAHAAVQLQRLHNNSTSNHRYDGDGQLLEDVSLNKTSKQLKSLVQETFPLCNVNLIHLVNAPQMYGMYLLRKEEMQLTYGEYSLQELVLYHVTSKSRAMESLKNGLDWRRTRRSKYGHGVSFSDDADYANYYADNRSKEDSRVIIVCAVLVNKTHRVNGKLDDGDLIVPPGCADTTVSFNGRVYVKYNDYDFYPLYFMHYQRSPKHLNESKYFCNNSRPKYQKNNRVMQLQQLQAEQWQQEQVWREKELQEQRYLEQEQKRRWQELQERRYLEQKQRRRWQEQARRSQLEQEHACRQQAQALRDQARQHKSNCLIL